MYFKNEIILYHCGRPSKQLAVFKEFKTTLKLIKNHRTFSLLVKQHKKFCGGSETVQEAKYAGECIHAIFGYIITRTI
jgi:predicted TIM-barrel fold metal-dependent hydrolase